MNPADPHLDVVRDDEVHHPRLCRPEQLNTLTPGFFVELAARTAEISAAGTARVLVLSSTGRDHTVADGLDRTALWQAGMRHDQDAVESWRAFRAERPARFDPLLPD